MHPEPIRALNASGNSAHGKVLSKMQHTWYDVRRWHDGLWYGVAYHGDYYLGQMVGYATKVEADRAIRAMFPR